MYAQKLSAALLLDTQKHRHQRSPPTPFGADSDRRWRRFCFESGCRRVFYRLDNLGSKRDGFWIMKNPHRSGERIEFQFTLKRATPKYIKPLNILQGGVSHILDREEHTREEHTANALANDLRRVVPPITDPFQLCGGRHYRAATRAIHPIGATIANAIATQIARTTPLIFRHCKPIHLARN